MHPVMQTYTTEVRAEITSGPRGTGRRSIIELSHWERTPSFNLSLESQWRYQYTIKTSCSLTWRKRYDVLFIQRKWRLLPRWPEISSYSNAWSWQIYCSPYFTKHSSAKTGWDRKTIQSCTRRSVISSMNPSQCQTSYRSLQTQFLSN